jgi:hypothetical protein
VEVAGVEYIVEFVGGTYTSVFQNAPATFLEPYSLLVEHSFQTVTTAYAATAVASVLNAGPDPNRWTG